MSYVFSLGDPFYYRPSQKSGDAYLFCNMLLAVQIECLDLDARYILCGERIIAENDEIGNHTGCKSAAFILLMAHICGICRYHAQCVETRYALVRIGMIYGARHTVQGLWTRARSVGAVAYDKSEAVHRSQRV